jgi:hypothetical protein
MAVRPACSRLSIQKPVSSAPIRGVSKFQGDVTSLFRSSGDLAEPRLWPVIPAPCARVERMMPAAQAGGTRAAEQRAVLPARPSGPAPVLGDAGRRSRVQSRRKRVPRPPEAWSCWRAAEKWQASGTRPYTEGQSSPIACCSASDQASQGRRIIHFSRSEITDKLLGPTAPWNSVLARLARPLQR